MTGRIALVALAACFLCECKAAQLILGGDHRTLRARAADAHPSSPDKPPIVLLALDGVSRDLLYDMIRGGELPNTAALLGGDGLAHAHLDDSFESTMPSTTMAAWATALTGVAPAYNGITGNEFFIRETRTLACPAPVSFSSTAPTLEIYSDDYLGKLIQAPTVYERLRKDDPDALIWVVMSQVFRGADQLVLVKPDVLGAALGGYVSMLVSGHESGSRDVYAALDTGAVESVVDRLASGVLPDVLTVYLYGTDLYAHVAPEGPDPARRGYLREIVDPAIGKLVARLRERGVLDRTWVVVTSDHGHTEVMADHLHALGGANDGPPAVLRSAGFRVRPFAREVAHDAPFSAVLAYGGATAYVYLADRSQCPGEHDACAWENPPRYRDDVLPAADAFWRANAEGAQLHNTLDMILVREPRPVTDNDLPFEVYVGSDKTVPVETYLAAHPHPGYVAFAERLHDLAVGPHGERAGDILLVAHDAESDDLGDRFYFAHEYHSWHGSPSRRDSDIPLIVANRHHRSAEIAAYVHRVLGDSPFPQKLTDIILGLRRGALGR
jgi:hypothetical protein